jgi:hypothetical protein
MSSTAKKRMNFDLNSEVDALLEGVAKKLNVSKSEVIRKSVKLMDIAVTTAENGGSVQIKDKDGNPHSIVIL